MEGNNTMTIETIQKRDGRMVAFDESKIADAIFKAAKAVGGADRAIATELASVVTHFLQKRFEGVIPGIEEIEQRCAKRSVSENKLPRAVIQPMQR